MASSIVFISVFHAFISKNILQTDVFRVLSENVDTHLYLLVPEEKEQFFRDRYAGVRVSIVPVPTGAMASIRSNKRWSALFRIFVDGSYTKYKRYEALILKKGLIGRIEYTLLNGLIAVLRQCPFLRTPLRFWYLNRVDATFFETLIDTYKPKTVFSTDAFDEVDALLQAASRRKKVPLITMVRSWDNCWSKGLLRVTSDQYIANNQVLKEELVTLHGIPQERIFIGGQPQYDRFFTKQDLLPRTSFLSSLGIDPSKRFILFAPAGAILSDTDADICDILSKAIEDGRLPPDLAVLVRNHPHHPAVFPALSDTFIIDQPGSFSLKKNQKMTELDTADIVHLANSLAHCELLMYVATTLGIDALPFDRPQIVIDFDGYKQKPPQQSVHRYHREDHMKKMLACGGVRIVRSPEDLIKAVQAYLAHPELDREGREDALRQQIFFSDAKSGERIGRFILEWMASRSDVVA